MAEPKLSRSEMQRTKQDLQDYSKDMCNKDLADEGSVARVNDACKEAARTLEVKVTYVSKDKVKSSATSVQTQDAIEALARKKLAASKKK